MIDFNACFCAAPALSLADRAGHQFQFPEDGYAEGQHNAWRLLLESALRQLPRLERLGVDTGDVPRTMALPPGPWQHTLKQLAVPADLLEASLPALGGASRLTHLGIGAAGEQYEQAAALRVLRWAARQRPLAVRHLAL